MDGWRRRLLIIERGWGCRSLTPHTGCRGSLTNNVCELLTNGGKGGLVELSILEGMDGETTLYWKKELVELLTNGGNG